MSHPILPLSLAFCACFVDVVCILGLFHTFTAFITGSLVVLCAELFVEPIKTVPKIIVIATFFVSSLFWYVLVTRLQAAGHLSLRILLLTEAGLLLLFMLIAITAAPLSGPLAVATIVSVMLSAFAMALQSVVMRVILKQHAPTTIMTGNFLNFVAAIVDTRSGSRDDAADAPGKKADAAKFGSYLVAFVLGGVCGGFFMTNVSFWALLLPILLLCVAALTFSAQEFDAA